MTGASDTTNDTERQSRIVDLYQKVLQVPYAFSSPADPDILFTKNSGICSEKNTYLAKEFHKMGIPVRFVLVGFDWSALSLPKEVLAARKGSLRDTHLYMEAKLNGRWTTVDATWDPALSAAGFTMTKAWDGASDTKTAVPERFKLRFPYFLYRLVELYLPLQDRMEVPFHKALNAYFEKIRRETPSADGVSQASPYFAGSM